MDPEVQIQFVAASNSNGGYDFEFVDELSRSQICPICLVAMRNPVQTTCGHRFCEECLLETFRDGNDRICPQDRNPIPEEGGMFHDVAWERDILSLRVKCKRNERGCDWTGQLRHYQEHVMACLYEDVACAKCDENVQRRFLLAHATSECCNRIVQCEYCEEEFEFWRTEVHEGEECTRFPLDCPQQCGVAEIAREELESHIRDDCLMTVVACPYNDAGCNFSDKRINLEAHTKGSIEDHLRKTWTQLIATKEERKKINEIEGRVMEIQDQMEKFQTDQRQIETSMQKSKDKNKELELLVRKLEEENVSLRGELTELKQQLAKTNESLPKRFQSEKEENKKEIRVLTTAVGMLQTEVAQMKVNTVNQRRVRPGPVKKTQTRLNAMEEKERSRGLVENAEVKVATSEGWVPAMNSEVKVAPSASWNGIMPSSLVYKQNSEDKVAPSAGWNGIMPKSVVYKQNSEDKVAPSAGWNGIMPKSVVYKQNAEDKVATAEG